MHVEQGSPEQRYLDGLMTFDEEIQFLEELQFNDDLRNAVERRLHSMDMKRDDAKYMDVSEEDLELRQIISKAHENWDNRKTASIIETALENNGNAVYQISKALVVFYIYLFLMCFGSGGDGRDLSSTAKSARQCHK